MDAADRVEVPVGAFEQNCARLDIAQGFGSSAFSRRWNRSRNTG
jgi:hypothetical protein